MLKKDYQKIANRFKGKTVFISEDGVPFLIESFAKKYGKKYQTFTPKKEE